MKTARVPTVAEISAQRDFTHVIVAGKNE